MTLIEEEPAVSMLWRDDVRTAPAGWVHVRSVNEAIVYLEQHQVTYASLDHDLGTFAEDGGDGVKLTDWMAAHDQWPALGIRVHSSNPVAVATMLATIDRYGPYRSSAGPTRGQWPLT